MWTGRFGVLAAASLLMAGCATYQDTSRKLNSGYYQDLQIQAEREKQLAQDDQIALQRDLSTVQQKQQDMTAEQVAASKQLAKIDADLAAASQQLDAARNQESRQPRGLREIESRAGCVAAPAAVANRGPGGECGGEAAPAPGTAEEEGCAAAGDQGSGRNLLVWPAPARGRAILARIGGALPWLDRSRRTALPRQPVRHRANGESRVHSRKLLRVPPDQVPGYCPIRGRSYRRIEMTAARRAVPEASPGNTDKGKNANERQPERPRRRRPPMHERVCHEFTI